MDYIKNTILPYGLGTITAAAFFLKAAFSQTGQFDKKSFMTLTFFLLVILCTPYSLNIFFSWAHLLAAGGLFISALVISCRFVSRNRSWINIGLLALEIAAIPLIILSLGWFQELNLLATGEAIAMVAFGVLLTKNLLKAEKT